MSVFIYSCLYGCVYMFEKQRALFQNQSANPKIDVAMPMPRLEELFINMYISRHIYIYIYIYEKLFTKTQSLNLALQLQSQFVEWRLARFGKELFSGV